MKLYLKTILRVFVLILIFTFILTVFHYFNIINERFLDLFKMIISSITIIMGGYKIGKNSIKKGWLEGIKFGLIIISIFLVIVLIFKFDFSIKNLIYYLIILLSSVFGGMIGISKKPQNHNN